VSLTFAYVVQIRRQWKGSSTYFATDAPISDPSRCLTFIPGHYSQGNVCTLMAIAASGDGSMDLCSGPWSWHEVCHNPSTLASNHHIGLFFDSVQSFQGSDRSANSYENQEESGDVCSAKKPTEIAIRFTGGCYCLLFGCLLTYWGNTKLFRILGPALLGLGFGAFLLPAYYGDCENKNWQPPPLFKPSSHSNNTVPQQYMLTSLTYWGTVISIGDMQVANVLSADKQTSIIGALAEGSSIRSIERQTGVHRDTIMRLGVRVGQGCASLMDAKMRNLSCEHLQFDEIWGFVVRAAIVQEFRERGSEAEA
jgi:hypothetical protein